MAYTKAPENSTYDTKRVPLVGAPLQRDGSSYNKDQRFLNCFVEVVKDEATGQKRYFVKKRAGLQSVYNTGITGLVRGCIYDDVSQQVYFVIHNFFLVYDPFTNIANSIAVLGTTTGIAGFTQHHTVTNDYVVLLDGLNGFTVDVNTNVVAQILDANFPTPHIPFPVSLDGYLLVVKNATADIYNSNLDDPYTWTPGDFITAEMYPDHITALVKNNNYVCAVGTASIEYFFDAGNPTGSPLQRNDSFVLQFGSAAPYATVQTEKEVVVLGTTSNGGRTVWLIDGAKAVTIGSEAVNQSLDSQGTNIVNANAYSIRIQGHKFYILRLADRTWVYDFDEKGWHEWSSTLTQSTFLGKFACDSPKGQPFMLVDGAGSQWVYYLNPEQYHDDNAGLINTQLTTLKNDFDVMNRKFMYRFSVVGDWPLATSTANITLDWSDDDYRTWVGNRVINIVQDIPTTFRLGNFRRRAFRLTFTEDLPMRLEAYEVDYNKGNS